MRLDRTPLRHGYTIADLHTLTRLAVHTALGGGSAVSWHDRYDTAWSAMAEYLYTVTEHPQRRDLVRAGQLAILAHLDDHRQTYGYYRRKSDGDQHGAFSSPAFRAYWWDLCGATPARSPENSIVERTALAQILPLLTSSQQHAILALAIHGDYQSAAASLGMAYQTFTSHIARGRTRFRAWWHEGEEPSKPWGCDRRVDNHGQRINGRASSSVQIKRRRAAGAARKSDDAAGHRQQGVAA
jgi:hypothetical protein